MKKLIDNKDYKGIEEALINDPGLANEGLPYSESNTTKGHPLHRLCDGVFSNTFTDEEAVEIAKIFIKYGANINGNGLKEKKDTPLIAAASLTADQVAILYIEQGAAIQHAGTHGGTALHWAAWCGRYKVVDNLIVAGAEINKLCVDFKSTPLFWAVHGLKNGGTENTDDTLQCVKLLMQAGADTAIPNAGGITVFDLLGEEDLKLAQQLNASS